MAQAVSASNLRKFNIGMFLLINESEAFKLTKILPLGVQRMFVINDFKSNLVNSQKCAKQLVKSSCYDFRSLKAPTDKLLWQTFPVKIPNVGSLEFFMVLFSNLIRNIFKYVNSLCRFCQPRIIQYVSIIFCLVTAIAASSSSVFIFGSSIRFMQVDSFFLLTLIFLHYYIPNKEFSSFTSLLT